MQDKIIAAIAAYLEKETSILGYHRRFFFVDKDCNSIAAEIAAAIAGRVEAGEVDDSQYTEDFLKWREKYFDRKTQVKHFKSKHNGEFRDIKQLERQYERAYNCNSKKSK